MDGLFGDSLVDVLCCGGDSLEEVQQSAIVMDSLWAVGV